MKNALFYSLVSFLCIQVSIAQNIVGKVIDAKTGESIPYANIMVNGSESLVTNEDGYFTLSEKQSEQGSTLVVSYLGYVGKRVSVGQNREQQMTIGLEQGVVELADVNVSNVKPDPTKIMAQVRKNLLKNYKMSDNPSKDKLFFRQAMVFKPTQMNFEITKSTGFTKNALKEANQEMTNYTKALTIHPTTVYTDILCNYYRDKQGTVEKPTSVTKLEVLKAIQIKNENRLASLEEMQASFSKVLLRHLDTTKYYRMKSGIIGTRDTVSLRKDFQNKGKIKTKTTDLESSKTSMAQFLKDNSFVQGTKLEFVSEPEIYEYTYEGAVYSAENEFVYVLSFKPKKNRAIYRGKLYVSETDFAVVKANYQLAEGKKVSGINLKFLLGIKVSENVSNGIVIYKKKEEDEGYYLQYASSETGNYMYFDRPLKFIELAEEDRDVLAFDLKMEANSIKKLEMLNIAQSEVSDPAFKEIDEKDFAYTKMKKYDPKVWQDYSTIEPRAEMKQFSAE